MSATLLILGSSVAISRADHYVQIERSKSERARLDGNETRASDGTTQANNSDILNSAAHAYGQELFYSKYRCLTRKPFSQWQVPCQFYPATTFDLISKASLSLPESYRERVKISNWTPLNTKGNIGIISLTINDEEQTTKKFTLSLGGEPGKTTGIHE